MCESYNRQFGRDYRSVMPSNLYGIGDNYHSKNSHVVPALIRRFHDAKTQNLSEVVVWGTGKPKREFLFVDDMAKASLFIHNLKFTTWKNITTPTLTHINVGSGFDIKIKELAEIIKDIIGFRGNIIFDSTKPDGTLRKLLDVKIINSLGWKAETSLKKGLEISYLDFLKNHNF